MATQDGSIDVPDSSENASEGDIDVEKANVDTLHRNAIGMVGLVAGAAGAVGAAAAVGGPVQVEVVVTAAVVEPMLIGCFVLIKGEEMCCLIRVTSGAQGARSSLYGLPRPVGSITTDAWWRPSSASGSSSSSASDLSWLSANSSVGVTSMSVACTSLQKGPR